MNKQEIDSRLECLLPGGVRKEEPMCKHTTFRIGGPAEWYICPPTDMLPQVLALVKETGVPLTVIGNGSNLLVADAGIRGIVLEIGRAADFVEIEAADAAQKADAKQEAEAEQKVETDAKQEAERKAEAHGTKISQGGSVRMRIGAGMLLSKAARVAADAGLSGMEFAAGIPGSLGGAVVMNAGAYGGEMKDILAEVTVLTPEGEYLVFSKRDEQDGHPQESDIREELPTGCKRVSDTGQDARKESLRGYRDIEELDLSYRHSVIPERQYIVVEAVVELTPSSKEEILAQMADLRQRRVDKQPLEFPSAGSTFKRPEGYFAGKLIQDAGLKGYTVGGAQVSPKHSGFVINTGDATAADVRQLIMDVQERVMQQFGVKMEPEVRMLGDFIS